MSDVFLQVLFHSSVYLIFRLLLKNRIMIILMANSNHTCLLVSRRTPVSGINCVFSFVIFNSITSPRAASIRCFMTAVFPFDVACTGFEYLSFSSFLEIETAYFSILFQNDIVLALCIVIIYCISCIIRIFFRNIIIRYFVEQKTYTSKSVSWKIIRL